jgi:hypothetical protein
LLRLGVCNRSIDTLSVDEAVVAQALETLAFVVIGSDIVELAKAIQQGVARQALHTHTCVYIIGKALVGDLNALIIVEIVAMCTLETAILVVAEAVRIHVGNSDHLRLLNWCSLNCL